LTGGDVPAGHEGGAEGARDLRIGRQEYLALQPVAHEFDDSSIQGNTARHRDRRLYTDAPHDA
jgi:hypothetical protein